MARRRLVNAAAMLCAWALLVLLLIGLGALKHARAAPPPVGSEDWSIMSDYGDWISTLAVDGVMCCSSADGRPVAARMRGEHWQVRWRIGQLPGAPTDWTDVPDAAVHRGANPVGVPIAWWAGGKVRCFAPAGGI